MNTKIIAALVLVTVIAAPAFADTDLNYPDQPVAAATQAGGVTRAQVRAELVQLEKAGYNPDSDNTQYPLNLQTAEAHIARQDHLASNDARVVGGKAVSTIFASARPADHDGTASVYFGS